MRMAMRGMSMVSSFLMIAGLMMLRRFFVVAGSVLVMPAASTPRRLLDRRSSRSCRPLHSLSAISFGREYAQGSVMRARKARSSDGPVHRLMLTGWLPCAAMGVRGLRCVERSISAKGPPSGRLQG